MSFEIPAGKWVRGFLASDGLNVDQAIPLIDSNGVAYTLQAGDRFVLEEAIVSNGATASKITLYSDADGSGSYNAGEELFVVLLAVNSIATFPMAGNSVLFCRQSDGANKGKIRAVASAASVGTSITIVGRIIKS